MTAREAVPRIDLARQMPHDTRLFFDSVHYTSDGEEKVAEIVAQDSRRILAERYPAHIRPDRRPGPGPRPPGSAKPYAGGPDGVG